MDEPRLARYLARIGAPRDGEPDVARLADLQERHLHAAPFENLVHLDEPIELVPDALVDKIVERHRGGFCYELNGAFGALLTALGYDVTMLCARAATPEGLGPSFDHLALRVEVDGEPWLVDVGFGRFAHRPIRLDERGEQKDPGGTFLVTDDTDGDLTVLCNGAREYRLETRPRTLADFEPTCWWHRTSPKSHFIRSLVCSRLTETGRVTLSGNLLIVTDDRGKREQTLTSDADVLDAYRRHLARHRAAPAAALNSWRDRPVDLPAPGTGWLVDRADLVRAKVRGNRRPGPGAFSFPVRLCRYRGAPMSLSSDELARALALRDLTDPAAGPHAMQEVVTAVTTALREAGGGVPVRVARGERIVTVHDNYDALRYSAAAATRDRRYTRYVGDGRMLRAHTTAHIPSLLRQITTDTILVVPGICYRRDVIDRHHVGEPHQMDVWRVRPGGPPVGDADLVDLIGVVVGAALPGRTTVTPPSPHPYTLDGREIYVDGVEIGECGLAHPEVLAGAGLPPGASGLAMGLGLDRITMLAKGMDDIRLLRSTDPRVAAQMTDLRPYRPVSGMPPIRRDLSIATDADVTPELVGDRVRAVLGPDADSVEEIEVLAETAYEDLPPAARERLGVRAGQKNLLVRLVVRDHERTLTAADANRLRDRVYAGLHEGTAHE